MRAPAGRSRSSTAGSPATTGSWSARRLGGLLFEHRHRLQVALSGRRRRIDGARVRAELRGRDRGLRSWHPCGRHRRRSGAWLQRRRARRPADLDPGVLALHGRRLFQRRPCQPLRPDLHLRPDPWPQRVLELSSSFDIAAVNMSLGGPDAFPGHCDDDLRKLAIDELRSAGIATVAAAGNEGSDGRVDAPACISSAIAVGSTTKRDRISTFSDHGDIVDLLAPGSRSDPRFRRQVRRLRWHLDGHAARRGRVRDPARRRSPGERGRDRDRAHDHRPPDRPRRHRQTEAPGRCRGGGAARDLQPAVQRQLRPCARADRCQRRGVLLECRCDRADRRADVRAGRWRPLGLVALAGAAKRQRHDLDLRLGLRYRARGLPRFGTPKADRGREQR